MRRAPFVFLALAALVAACSGSKEAPPLPGERIPILLTDERLEPDPLIADLDVSLPPPFVNPEWPQQGGYPNHAMQHLALDAEPAVVWRADAGEGASKDELLLSSPIVAEGRVYAMDTRATVSAFDFADGGLLWRTELEPEDEEDGSWGGGLAYADGRVFVSTGFGEVIALASGGGDVLWRTPVSGPMRAAPAAGNGRVFAVTKDNQLHALNAQSGDIEWTHTGIAETAGLVGGGAPAIGDNIVIVPYSSGELFALRAENGRSLWSDNLSAIRRVDAVSAMADIRGRPVVDGNRVYAISHSGRMVSIDVRSGRRIWEASVGGTEQPWIAGDFIFLLTTDGFLVCMTARDGRIRWTRRLVLFLDEANKEDRVLWTGPVLAGEKLYIANDRAALVALSPFDGQELNRWEIPGGVPVAPAVADETLLFLTLDGDLQAWR